MRFPARGWGTREGKTHMSSLIIRAAVAVIAVGVPDGVASPGVPGLDSGADAEPGAGCHPIGAMRWRHPVCGVGVVVGLSAFMAESPLIAGLPSRLLCGGLGEFGAAFVYPVLESGPGDDGVGEV